MKKLTARQIEALGIVAANQPLPLYDPEGPIDFKRAFAGHMASTATSLIDRGLVEVIEHREWILTDAGRELLRELDSPAAEEAPPAAPVIHRATETLEGRLPVQFGRAACGAGRTVRTAVRVTNDETRITCEDCKREAEAQRAAYWAQEAMEDDGLAAAEMGYERYLENRGSDEYTAIDLAAHDEAWPHGYGICSGYAANDLPCGLGIYHPGDHVGCSCRHRHDDIDPACPIHGENPIEPDTGDGEERRIDPWTGEELVRLVEDDEAPLSETDLNDGADIPGPEAFYDPGYGYDPEKAERLLAEQLHAAERNPYQAGR